MADTCDRRYFPGIITREEALRNDPQLKGEPWDGPGLYMVGRGKVGNIFYREDGSLETNPDGTYKTDWVGKEGDPAPDMKPGIIPGGGIPGMGGAKRPDPTAEKLDLFITIVETILALIRNKQ